MHLIIAAPASLVLGACLLDRALRPWRELRAVGSVTAAGLVAGCVLVAAVAVVAAKAGPTFAQAIALDAVQVATPTVRVGVEDRGADDLGAFGLTAAYVRENTESGQKVLAFPALTGVLFAAERQSPVYHDYWYPGRPNREEETDMVDALRADPPALVVSLNQGWTFFSRSPLYFASVREFVVDNYRLTARFGRYDVLAPRELAATIKRSVWQPRSGGPGRGARDAGQAGADIYAVVPAYRRQAARRWLAGMRAETCRSAVLDAAPRLATLRLRAIHDGGDARAVGWLLQGYRRTEARVREQSLRAMSQATERLEAARFRWANDFDPRPYALCAEPWLGELRSLAFDGGADVDPRAQSFALALVRTLFAETAPGKP